MIDFLLLLLLVVSAIAICYLKDLMGAVVVFFGYSLIMSLIWVRLNSPDLALLEAVVGGCLVIILFLITISKTEQREE